MTDSSEDCQSSENSPSTQSKDINNDDFNVESGIQNSIIPRKGMQFQSHEEAYKFYKNIALVQGFGIRRYSTYKSRNSDVIVRRTFVCNRKGYKKKQDAINEKNIKRRRESRRGCKAFMEIVLIKCGFWEIKKFSDIHSHELLKNPSKKRKLRSHNKSHRESSCKKLIEQFRSCGVGPAKISRIINSANGSASDVVTPQQCSDFFRIKRKNNIDNECMIVIQNFLERKARDSKFYYAISSMRHRVVVKEGGETSYEVDFKEMGKSHIVDVNVFTQFCKCSCAKFETWGIPCKYMLYIMKHKLRLKVIPDVYILRRWTLSVRYRTTSDVYGENGSEVETDGTNNSKEITALNAWTFAR